MSNKSRRLERFMPYSADRGGLVIRSVHVAVDDEPRGNLASDSPLGLGSRPWQTLQLRVALERTTALDQVLHPDELVDPPVAVVLAVRCRATFLSLSQCIQQPDPTAHKYEHTATLCHNELRGELTITPHLVRTKPHPRTAGLASRKGAWLANGEPWILHVDETKPRQGNDLEVLRKPFSEVPGIAPADRHNWFALQLDDASPRLFLNEEHPSIMTVLYDTTKRGKNAVLREALYDQISATVWPTLLLHAARAWSESDGDTYPWQVNILRLWSKRLRPDAHDLDVSVRELVQHALRNPAEFSLEINAAMQRDNQVRHIERLLTEVSQ